MCTIFGYELNHFDRYLKWLGQNDDIYNMYLDWKVKGVSENFKWIMSISAVHSNCRSI
jgi:hypothetical protein